MSFLKEYTILAELGQGGFAKVYKVRHEALGYIRAIRVLNEPVTDENSHTYRNFLRECKVLLRLGNGSHRNIVHIYQPRLLDNHALVEMDYVDGQNLSHYLKANGNFLPADEVLRMVEQMSSALAYCHEDIYKFCMDREADNLQDDPMDGSRVLVDEATRRRLIEKYKVIHNDIHSGNIMRREDGSFVLLDFGLAIEGGDNVINSSRHNNGAVEYKAPEKWDNDAVLTEQCDIYSFGVVMYEYLAGRVPFPYDENISNKTEATYNIYKAHKEQLPPPISELRKAFFEAKYPHQTYQKDYPDWLEAAIMRCLEKDPGKRFRNGKELHEFVVRHLAKEAERAFYVKVPQREEKSEESCWAGNRYAMVEDRLKTLQQKDVGKQKVLDEQDKAVQRPSEQRHTENKSKRNLVLLIASILVIVAAYYAYNSFFKVKDEDITVVAPGVYHFVGKIGGQYDIHMSIIVNGTTVSGRYYYDNQRKKGNNSSLILCGKINGNSMNLTESNSDGLITGWFDGNWVSGAYKGAFTRKEGGKTFDFNLVAANGGEGFFKESEITIDCQ